MAAVLREKLDGPEYDDLRHLSIKISGCPNSCGQHHIADIGFFGSSKRHGGHVAPHFQVVLGGQQQENAARYGLAIGKIPAKRAPEFVERILELYRREARPGERFAELIEPAGEGANQGDPRRVRRAARLRRGPLALHRLATDRRVLRSDGKGRVCRGASRAGRVPPDRSGPLPLRGQSVPRKAELPRGDRAFAPSDAPRRRSAALNAGYPAGTKARSDRPGLQDPLCRHRALLGAPV
ncbi:MAG: hypothetical protein KatS3mg115_0172 [Candidatus Poribacteria bacterium]|nr:MAG: hypothetical protein KatS3mg115_0172 [Candidatus Poribacteria bacterium]